MTESVPSDLKAIVPSGLFLAVLGLLLTAMTVWILRDSHNEYLSLLSQGAPLLMQNTGISALYAGPILFIAVALFGIGMLWAVKRGKRYSKTTNKRILKAMNVMVIGGLIGMFAGRPLANHYWAETFSEAGYIECVGGFSITKQWLTAVWAEDPSLCLDGEVRRMFSSYEYRLPDINAYVEAQRFGVGRSK